MRTPGRLIVALLLVLAIPSPSLARAAAIQTSAPLADDSDASVKAAAKEAVSLAVRGAMAMGLPKVQLNQAIVLDKAVVIEILATDADTNDEGRVEAGSEAGPDTAPLTKQTL